MSYVFHSRVRWYFMSIVTGLKCLLKDTYQYFAMASSYVEVKESGDSGNDLPIEITTCESNGVDIQEHLDGEPPRDHTYNKDPDVILESEVIHSIEEEAPAAKEDITKRKTKQQKAKKLQNTSNKSMKAISKKESSKKSSRKKVQEVSETPDSTTIDQENAKAIEEDYESISSKPGLQKNPRKRKNVNGGNAAIEAKQVKSSDSDLKADSTEEDQKLMDNDSDEEKNKKVLKKSKVAPAKSAKTKALSNSTKAKKISEKSALTATGAAKAASKKSKDVGNADPNLPPGWTKKIVVRKSGKTAGAFDIYIYSPEGIKFRSKPDIAAYLTRTKSHLKLEDFDFTRRQVGADAPENKVSQTKIAASPISKKKSSSKKSAKIVVKLSTPRRNALSDHDDTRKKQKNKPDGALSSSSSASSKRVGRKK